MVNKKKILIMLILLTFSSISIFSTDTIYIGNNSQISDNKIINTTIQNNKLELSTNNLQIINNEKFIKQITQYYKNITITFDNYSMIISFNKSGISKIVEGYNKNNLHIKFTKDNVKYLINNWYKITTFEKIKYLTTLGVPINDIIKLSGIAMSIK